MSSTGLNGETGGILTGFDHVRQSIRCILTTPIGSRVMRRDFGSELFELIDRPLTDQVILAIYAAVVMALAPRKVGNREYGEPRFAVKQLYVHRLDATGTVELQIHGTEYPRGHLGDFTAEREVTFSIPFGMGR